MSQKCVCAASVCLLKFQCLGLKLHFQLFSLVLFLSQMGVSISLGFLIAWTPYVVVSFWSMFHSQEQSRMTPFITLLPCLFAKSSTMYNPFIYFIFRRAVWQDPLRLQRLWFCCTHQASLTSKVPKTESEAVKGSDCAALGDRVVANCVSLMEAPHRQSEILTLG